MQQTDWTPAFSRWRHGGWYVSNLFYPSGANGCVSNNYPDKKWRIVDDDRRDEINAPGDHTFTTRDAAARAEKALLDELTFIPADITVIGFARIANVRCCSNADAAALTSVGLVVLAADGWLDITIKGRQLLVFNDYSHDAKTGWTAPVPA